LLLAIVYSVAFNAAIRTDPAAAEYRFLKLMDANAPRRAAGHGERAVKLRLKAGASREDIAPLKVRLASAQVARQRFERAAELFRDALATDWAKALAPHARVNLENELGRATIHAGAIEEASSIYSTFLELAGDAAIKPPEEEAAPLAARYATHVGAAAATFAGALNHAKPYIVTGDSREAILASANHMAVLGGYYAMRGGEYAAAGLLSSVYETRKRLLGGEHQDTVQITLILGPLYVKMGRLKDAEILYRDALRAQERVKGANSPDLSLYLKLLASVYEEQERYTEAQAYYEHMRGLFRDAFGAQRYKINRERDRRADVNRPVSQYFRLAPDYQPSDLVSAAQYSIPTSKSPNIEEMKLRLAPDIGADPREANLPARLAQLISLCRSESGGERISLRSGYRAYKTQSALYKRKGAEGMVTPPGMSEHQTGLAADINVNDRFMRQSDRAFQCFEEYAFRYGFILSYPPGNDYLPGEETYEPWHWRYVGVQTAHLYREAGPHERPQEFLAVLPCYQERAASGYFPTAGEPDICLEQNAPVKSAMASPDAAQQPRRESGDAARILNGGLKTPSARP